MRPTGSSRRRASGSTAIGAGTSYYLGGSTTIPDGSQVSSLEITSRIGSQDMAAKLSPGLADVLVQASLYDVGWVGAVVGQIVNDHPTKLLSSAEVSTVIFDPSGSGDRRRQGLSRRQRPASRRPCVLQCFVRRRPDPDGPSRIGRRHGHRAIRGDGLVVLHRLASRAVRDARRFTRARVGRVA